MFFTAYFHEKIFNFIRSGCLDEKRNNKGKRQIRWDELSKNSWKSGNSFFGNISGEQHMNSVFLVS